VAYVGVLNKAMKNTKKIPFKPVFLIRIQSGLWIRIRIQQGKNNPQKWEKIKKFNVLKCWMFSFEG
jgi:hypothetical protein